MIGKLTGKVESLEGDRALLDVNGVGYLVFITAKTAGKLSDGITASLLIETYVREDLIQLFGFNHKDEKFCFNMLTAVSGVGPRMALAILSSLTPEDLLFAISSKDKEAFKRISGIGPKLAERIILELKDKAGNIAVSPATVNISSSINNNISGDAMSALVNLGISRQEAYNTINKILSSAPDINLDELIKQALKNRGLL